MTIILVILLHVQQTLELLSEVQFISNFLYFLKRKINSKLLLTNTLSKSEVFMENTVSLMMEFSIFRTEEDLVVQKSNLFKIWLMEFVQWLKLRKLFENQVIMLRSENSIQQKNWMISKLYSLQAALIQLFQEILLNKFGMSIKTKRMEQEFHLRLVYSQVLRTLIQVLDFMLVITVHIEFSTNFLIKLLKNIMAMDLMQLILLKWLLRVLSTTSSQLKMEQWFFLQE